MITKSKNQWWRGSPTKEVPVNNSLSSSARQANDQADKENKYARVMQEALAEKKSRQDLTDDRRPMNRPPTPGWAPTGE
jgi:hypothetical protein